MGKTKRCPFYRVYRTSSSEFKRHSKSILHIALYKHIEANGHLTIAAPLVDHFPFVSCLFDVFLFPVWVVCDISWSLLTFYFKEKLLKNQDMHNIYIVPVVFADQST